MSSANKGLRRVGIGGLSALVGSTVMFGLAAAPAHAATGVPTAPSTLTATSHPAAPTVTIGANNQAAGNATYEYTDAHNAGATVVLTLDQGGAASKCDTAATIAKSTFFASVPTVVDAAPAGGIAPSEAVTASLASSPLCAASGSKDELVLTFPTAKPAFTDGTIAGPLDVNISGITYNVGAGVPAGAINLTATPGGSAVGAAAQGWTQPTPAGPVQNATAAPAATSTFSVTPVEAATPGASGIALGTATLKTSATDLTPGSTTAITLTLSDTAGTSNFTPGVTPTITVPSGDKVTKDAAGAIPGTPATSLVAGQTYKFYVFAPIGSSGGTITVSGLKVDGSASVDTVDLTSTVPATATPQQAINLVNQARIGGADRFDTAARLFNSEIGAYISHACNAGVIGFPGRGCANAVLSGGTEFADALSANYLASSQQTGTLLTATNSLPDTTRNALQSNCVDTVYITGGTAAVSQTVADQVASLPVCGAASAFNTTIRVIRLAGANRYATNRTINETEPVGGGHADTAVLANGTAPFDSLSAGPLVYTDHMPLVLTAGTSMNNGEEAQLTALGGITKVLIVGGTGVVSQAIQDKLVADGYTVARVGGADRYATSVQVAKLATTGIDANGDGVINAADGLDDAFVGDLSPNTEFITNGQYYADALSAGPVAGDRGNVILLAQDANTPGAAITGFNSNLTTADVGNILSLGGTVVTSPALGTAVAAAIG